MAVVNMDFESQLYGGRHQINIILPDVPRTDDPRKFYPDNRRLKVLWLLHGTFGDCTDWIRRTMIEVYACEKNIAVVMPSGLNSDYVNWPRFGVGFSMYDYLFEELMPMIYSWYPISDRREDNYIAGLSMGGNGAVIYALNRPDKFAAAGSLSCPLISLDSRKLSANPPESDFVKPFRPDRLNSSIENCGGEEAWLKSKNNCWGKLIENYENGVDMPKLYFCIGENDFLFPDYKVFKGFAKKHGYDDIIFEEEPGYAHEWRFWDKYIERFLDLFVDTHPVDNNSTAF